MQKGTTPVDDERCGRPVRDGWRDTLAGTAPPGGDLGGDEGTGIDSRRGVQGPDAVSGFDPAPDVDAVPDDEVISDAELTALALAADPTAAVDPDAIPLHQYLSQVPALLPEWYMPGVMARHGNRWRTAVVLTIVAAFVIIEALGLCSTFGQLSLG